MHLKSGNATGSNLITVLIAGDFIPPVCDSDIYSEDLKQELQNKDYSIVNLEAPITLYNPTVKRFTNKFKVPPFAIKHIKNGFFDAVTLSNNHIRDFGNHGVLDTLKTCIENEMNLVGAGSEKKSASEALRVEIKGKRFAFFNYCENEFNKASFCRPGANIYDPVEAFYSISEAKLESDYVIVIYHGGIEHVKYPSPYIIKTFKFLADIGADAVIGHHTHMFSGMIRYKEKPLIFSLGNFYMESVIAEKSGNITNGILSRLLINESGYIRVNIVPVECNISLKSIYLPDKERKEKIQNEFDEISEGVMDESFLERQWASYYKSQRNRAISRIISSGHTEYKVRKHFPWLNIVSKYRLFTLLNTLRCASHHYSMVQILERESRDHELDCD